MKIYFFFIALLVFSSFIHVSAQENNELRFYYGTSVSGFQNRNDVDGGANFDVKNINEVGIRYLSRIMGNFYMSTGFNYLNTKTRITPSFTGVPLITRTEILKILSVPLFAHYSLNDFIFINGGLFLNFQLTENTVDPQSGIGYGFGIGGKYQFRNYLVFINPNFKRHAAVAFEKRDNHHKLTEVGVQLGLGYIF